MLLKKKIIAIHSNNFFLKEIISLIGDEGFEVVRIKNLSDLPDSFSKKIVFVGIDSQKQFKSFNMLRKRNSRSTNIFIILEKNSFEKLLDEDLNIIKPPIVFSDILKLIKRFSIIEKKVENNFNFGNFHFNSTTLELFDNVSNINVRLTELESRFLKYLGHSKKGFSKSELLRKVWGHNEVLNTHTLESLIYRIRKKIEEDPNDPKLLYLENKRYYLKIS